MAWACCLCFFQGSKSWIALLVPILAVFASFSSGPGLAALFISITVSVFLMLFSSLFSFTFSKQKPIMLDDPILKEAAEKAQEKHHQSAQQQKTLIKFSESSQDKAGEVVSEQAEIKKKIEVGENGEGLLIRSQDLYSESDQFSSTSSEGHCSDIEWPYNMEQRIDCSDDDSISDEESLIEIAIPSGQFVSPDKDPKLNPMYSKLTADLTMFQENTSLDFLTDMNHEMNEEDNLIEIDIYMGSIKCSSFQI